MSQPLVSVITIFLDAGRFIEEAIESVLAQTYQNWELWLVDDGSKDASTEIARRYAEKFSDRIHYLEHAGHENRGMSASRNLGIQQSRGEFIAFLDADDVWLPQKLERQVAALISQPQAAMVFGPTFEWHSWTGKKEDHDRDAIQKLNVKMNVLIPAPSHVTTALRNEAYSPGTCSVLLRREAVNAVGGFEERFHGMYEDQVFFSKVLLRYPVVALPECYDKYRQREDGCCRVSVKSRQYNADRLAYLNWLADYLTPTGNADVKAALEQQRRPLQHPRLCAMRTMLRAARHAVRKWVGRIAGLLPVSIHDWAQKQLRGPDASPRVGRVHLGGLRRLTPISRDFGFGRGQPVDRFYIEGFLAAHRGDIRGRVLEIGDARYTRQFGNDTVSKSEVLHVADGNPPATIVADLTDAANIPDNSFDCVILTQTLQFIYDTRAVLRTVRRILKPGGVLLATTSGISHHGRGDWASSWYWNFTTKSVRKLAEETFPPGTVEVEAHGNVLAATAFLQGLAAEELQRNELTHRDPEYEVLITLRAEKPLPESTAAHPNPR